MTIDKIISTNSKNFDRWSQQLEEHLHHQFNRDSGNKEEFERIFYQSNELLIGIAENFFTYAKFKDSWDTTKCSLNVFGQHLLLKSEKMDLIFYWGLDREGFYLETDIIEPENLRYMTDEFWEILLDLKDMGEFEFSEMGSLSAIERPFFENKTSVVFQMIRRFMLYQVEKMNGSNYQQPPHMEIGQLVLKWDFEIGWSNLLEQASRAFQLLYKLNYQLWKITDLGKKKSLKSGNTFLI
jgi:hypothetical protein